MFDAYFQTELDYFYRLAARCAREIPHAARLFARDSNPAFSRLAQGAAFLFARVRRRLDDRHSAIAEEWLERTAPFLLRSFPGASLVHIDPQPSLRGSLVVPAATLFHAPMPGGAPLAFRSTLDCELAPWSLESLEARRVGDAQVLGVKLRLNRERALAGRPPRAVSLWIATPTDDPRGWPLSLAAGLVTSVRAVDVRADGGGEDRACILPASAVSGPRAARAVQGEAAGSPHAELARLRELLGHPQAFCEVSIDLSAAKAILAAANERVELTLRCDAGAPRFDGLRTEDVKLHCTPVVNAFEAGARPARVTRDHRTYALEHAEHAAVSRRVDAVRSVSLVELETGTVHAVPLAGEGGTAEVAAPAYEVVRAASTVADEVDLSLALMGVDALLDKGPLELRARVDMTDGDAVAGLAIGAIRGAGPLPAGVAGYRNVTPVARRVSPRIAGERAWQMLRIVNAPLGALLQPGAVEALVGVLDPAAAVATSASAGRAEADETLQLRAHRVQRLRPGGIDSGLRLELDVRAKAFHGSGERWTWANLVTDVLAARMSHHELLEVSVRVSADEVIELPARRGLCAAV